MKRRWWLLGLFAPRAPLVVAQTLASSSPDKIGFFGSVNVSNITLLSWKDY